MTEDEKQTIELKNMYKRNPKKVPLDQSDMNIINNYIQDGEETIERRQATLRSQKQLDKDLQDFENARKAIDSDVIPEEHAKI